MLGHAVACPAHGAGARWAARTSRRRRVLLDRREEPAPSRLPALAEVLSGGAPSSIPPPPPAAIAITSARMSAARNSPRRGSRLICDGRRLPRSGRSHARAALRTLHVVGCAARSRPAPAPSPADRPHTPASLGLQPLKKSRCRLGRVTSLLTGSGASEADVMIRLDRRIDLDVSAPSSPRTRLAPGLHIAGGGSGSA